MCIFVNYGLKYDYECNVMDYGAKGDGKTDDTKAIQAAMNDCYLNNTKYNTSGLVILPSSKSFLSYPLYVTKITNAAFEIESSSTLIISNDRDNWPSDADFLVFHESNNIEIFGGGLINGQGEIWWANQGKFAPRTIYCHDCTNLLITNITIKDPPYHTLELYADNTEVSYVTILAPPSTGVPPNEQSHNTDAVDVHGSPFWIHDCYFDTGDDNVAVHANDTLVENCYFGNGHGASIGSLEEGYYKNITFTNIVFNGTTNGIRIKSDSGSKTGKVSDVYFKNLSMNKVNNTIVINQYYPNNKTESSKFIFDGVYIENVTAVNSLNAGLFQCQETTPCHHIELTNVNIQATANNGQFECEYAYGTASDTKPQSCLTPES
eukprot:CAMPEP_0201564580 /NCGR_PEP_ID=MMETSP0190_2-20130828/3012_1 /ASSEMBLY_ACC=CAM_ASM_000263 /TAXON_ID=37353 /ORGANISM="Rosalina sp." /LENGTH=377 /DNA_ID=CAMNT_0047980959 /DNA_START=81 /DNA_END=1214 /DNA_ORIENTATION=+